MRLHIMMCGLCRRFRENSVLLRSVARSSPENVASENESPDNATPENAKPDHITPVAESTLDNIENELHRRSSSELSPAAKKRILTALKAIKIV